MEYTARRERQKGAGENERGTTDDGGNKRKTRNEIYKTVE